MGDERNYGNRFGGGNYDMHVLGEGVGGKRFGNGHGVNGQNGERGPWIQEMRVNVDHDRYGKNHEEEQMHRYEDPTKSIKHTLSEFHGKFDPAAYLEWASQVKRIFTLQNYAEDDKVKLAIFEFRGYANTWRSDIMRRRRILLGRGEVKGWEELKELMRATFVPKSYFLKLQGKLQDLKQGARSVMEYYYELLSLMNKVGIEESDDSTQNCFIHGLNFHLRHTVKLEALRGITLSEVLSFSETIERQGKSWHLAEPRWRLAKPGEG